MIWDLPLRLFHGLLIVAVLGAYLTADWGGLWFDWHIHIGLLILALIVFRLVWGLVGSTHARFGQFFPTSERLHLFFRSAWSEPGHNPLGALSIFAMLGLLLAQVGTGLFCSNEDSDIAAPLNALISVNNSERLAYWHARVFNGLLGLIVLHLLAIAYYGVFKRDNLILPMITGKRGVNACSAIVPLRGGGTLRLLFAVALAGFVFWCIQSGALLRCLLGGT